MFRKLPLALALIALAAFGLAACGDDDSDSGESETTAAETTAEEAAGGGEGAGGGATEALAIEADPGGELAYTETELQAAPGTVEIAFDNPSSTSHDVRVESPEGEDVGGTDVITGSTTSAAVDLEAGDYTFYCSVDGHREAGMEGSLTVE